MIMASRQLLERNPRPTEDEIRDGTPGMSASLLVVLETGSHGNHADLGAGR
jgi:aerobic-type carbon monoxide dehydrogenase small subunit (CoxS/CutS family)